MSNSTNPDEHVQNRHRTFCVGFFILHDDLRKPKEVILVRKQRPAWQKNFLNGVGGEINPDEYPHAAMDREFREETGIDVPDSKWRMVAKLKFVNETVLYVFTVAMSQARFNAIVGDRSLTKTDEYVARYNVNDVLLDRTDLVEDVSWLLRLCICQIGTRNPVMLDTRVCRFCAYSDPTNQGRCISYLKPPTGKDK